MPGGRFASVCKYYRGSEGQLRTPGDVHALSFWERVGENCVAIAGSTEEPCKNSLH